MDSAQVKQRKSKEGRTGAVWSWYDPGSHYENLTKAVVEKFEKHLHPGERSPQGLLKMVIENLETALLAIRPNPVAPAINGAEEEPANVATS